MAVVNLLGDSIIDNKIYVGPHELSVSEHLYNLTDDHLEKNNIIKIENEIYKELNSLLMKRIQIGGGIPWQKN